MNGYPNYRQQGFSSARNAQNMMDAPADGLNFGMVEGQSLDDIVSQNDSENRRKSMPVYADMSAMQLGSPDGRRMSIMEFGDGSASNLGDFHFNMASGPSMDAMMRAGPAFAQSTNELQNDRLPGSNLAIDTQFSNQSSPYPNMQPPASAYASPMHPDLGLDMDMASPYAPGMPLGMDLNDPNLAAMSADMNLFSGNQFSTSMMDSPINPDFVSSMPPQVSETSPAHQQSQDHYGSQSMSTVSDVRPGQGLPTRTNSQEHTSTRSSSHAQSDQQIYEQNQRQQGNPTPRESGPYPKQSNASDHFADMKFPWKTPAGGFPSSRDSNPHMRTQYKNIYSSTGFDMLSVLMRVATRPNPQIDIGSVDLSCAFVVCDAAADDNPIVYCSENFERLTGYSKHMILGRNCRFLQSPDGKVESGVKRRYVDDDSVLYLKNMINTRQEAQISLINYRRGGQPFMNLLTMIPIPWEPGGETKFFVGFQVDLVEQPSSMQNKNPDGSYRVNYQRGMSMPSYIFNDSHKPHSELGQTISKDEVSNVLSAYGSSADSDLTRRIWDKVLLENADDVIHVLSLKGLFLYLSPSSNRILEYDPSELVGTALSSVCHPSDIVPVTRELKETTNGVSVNVVFRIRRKKSGYMWFEGHGSLHTEQGKGRKCIILVGRERPVYTLSKSILRSSGGIGDNELWSKMSTSGMFLFVSSNIRQLLDRQPEELVGTSIQTLMRQESKQSFGKILEMARTGVKAEIKHEMINRRGQVLQAFTTIYPGDATEGQKPTFVVAQTRLLKYSRSMHGQRPSLYQSKSRNTADSAASLHTVNSGTSPAHLVAPGTPGGSTPMTNVSDTRYNTTDGAPTTFAGNNGLRLGHQDSELASDDNVFDELKTTRSTSWQYELRQMEKRNRYLAEEVQSLLAAKKKRKRRKGAGQLQKDCANCHTRTTPEWRRGPSGNRDLCNSCGLRWAKQNGRVSPRTSSQHSQSDKSKKSASPRHPQSNMPNEIPENGTRSSIPSALAPGETRGSGQASTSHAAKVARMEAAASQGYGGGIPEKIDEGFEPD